MTARSLPRCLRTPLAFVCLVATVVAGEVQPFTAKSYDAIRRAHAGRPFILAFCSVACEPCRDELLQFVALHRATPQLPIVLVVADPPKLAPNVKRFLAGYALDGIETWQFADDFMERLRYSVDRSWQGELPRAYFFDAAHRPTAQSGVPDPAWVKAWVARETGAAAK